MIVSRIAVTPLDPIPPDWAALLPLVAVLLLAGALFVATRSRRAALSFGGIAAIIVGTFAAIARPFALFLIYLPSLHPAEFGLALIGVIALIFLAAAVARVIPRAPSLGIDSARAEKDGEGPIGTWPWARYGHVGALLALTAVAGVLRFGGLNALSLWLDEGATIHFADLSWWRVLGLEGRYDLHPPLYYALVKLITPLASPATAGRLVSAIAGTLTVGAIYAIGTWLLNWRVGVAAALLLAVSPLHIWYSQEGRMYALAVFLVALAALALVGFTRSGARGSAAIGWSALFGLATLLAAYTVYSAFYTLIPLGIAIPWFVARYRWRATPIVVASGVALLLYLPWLPQLLQTTTTVQGDAALLQGREDLLAANGESVGGSLLSLSGAGGTLGVMANSRPLFWSRWPIAHYPLVFLLVAVIVVGMVIASRRAPLAAIVGAAFLPGTVLIGILVSRVSPGYADRTVLAATVGWALLAGGLAFATRPRWLGALSLISLALILAISMYSLGIVRASAWKQPYRDLVTDAARVAPLGRPIAPLSSWMPSFIEAYAPTLPTVTLLDSGGRLVSPNGADGATDALWLIYADNPWDNVEAVRRQLIARGYERRLHKFYRRSLYLDLYAMPGTRLGKAMALDQSFAVRPGGWSVPTSGAQVRGEGTATTLSLSNTAKEERIASLDLPIRAAGLVTIEVALEGDVPASQLGASLTCLSATGSPLELEANEGMQTFAADMDWHAIRTATLCPVETATVRIKLRNSGIGTVSFRELRLYEAPLSSGQDAEHVR